MRPLLFILCVFLFSGTCAQRVMTLEDALRLTLENNYGIRIARSEREISANNYTIGNAGFLPVVMLNANHNSSLVNGEQTRGDTPPEDIEDGRNRSSDLGARLTWTLFDGTGMFVDYDILNAQNLQSSDALEFSVETAIYNVSTHFYLACLEDERLKLLQSNLALSKDRLSLAKDRYALGKGSKLEYLQAQVDFNTDQSDILNQRLLLETQKLELLRQIGISDSADLQLLYTLDRGTPIALDDLLSRIADNKALSMLARQQEIAALREKASRADKLPVVSVFASYDYSQTQRAVGFSFESNTTNLSYGFSARFTLFDGWNASREVHNSGIGKKVAGYEYRQRVLNIETRIKQQYVAYVNGMERLKLEEQNVLVARESNDIAKERYDIGLSNAVEYRESQVNLMAAESRRQNAQFAARLAEIELRYLAGAKIAGF